MTQEKIIDNFTRIIHETLPHYLELTQIDNGSNISKRFKSEFRKAFKWWLRHLGTLIPPKASEEALKKVADYHIDLFALQWKDQPEAEAKITTIKGRSVIYHEHQVTVDEIFELILTSKTKNNVRDALLSHSIVWITREEEKRLPKYNRDLDAYKKANIVVRNNPYGDLWMDIGWDINKRKSK